MNIVSKFTTEKNIQYQTDEGFRNNINFILTFVSILVFGLFAIRPSINTITALVKDIGEYQKVNGILIEKIEILNEAKSNPEKLKQESELISKALPGSPQEGEFLKNVNFIATKNEVVVEGITFASNTESKVGTLDFNITVSGGYPEFVNFVSDLNKLLRITNIQNIQITPIESGNDAVHALVTGQAYFFERND